MTRKNRSLRSIVSMSALLLSAAVLVIISVSPSFAQSKARARELGLSFEGTPLALALITPFVGCASRLLKNVLNLKVEDAEAIKLEDKTAIVPFFRGSLMNDSDRSLLRTA